MLHFIPILNHFADAILNGERCFDIRENDRGYQKGDFIRYQVVDYTGCEIRNHELNDGLRHTYEITYVLNGHGLKENYIVFGIKECSNQ